jgi:acetolactate synthase-1/2/3 large subunit
MLGMHGTYAANMAMAHADLIVAVGAQVAYEGRIALELAGHGLQNRCVEGAVRPCDLRNGRLPEPTELNIADKAYREDDERYRRPDVDFRNSSS